MSPDMHANATEGQTTALACVAGAIPATERNNHFALIARLFSDARERHEIDDGYAFRFDEASFDDVARFVTNERECCPFLHFVIELSPRDGTLWLRLTGPTGTREFLAAELPLTS